MKNIEEIKAIIIAKANEEARCDDEEHNAYDSSGGNYDDAFSQGMDDGEIIFARQLLKFFEE